LECPVLSPTKGDRFRLDRRKQPGPMSPVLHPRRTAACPRTVAKLLTKLDEARVVRCCRGVGRLSHPARRSHRAQAFGPASFRFPWRPLPPPCSRECPRPRKRFGGAPPIFVSGFPFTCGVRDCACPFSLPAPRFLLPPSVFFFLFPPHSGRPPPNPWGTPPVQPNAATRHGTEDPQWLGGETNECDRGWGHGYGDRENG